MDTLVDTQVLSYFFKKVESQSINQNLIISSITANEFLLAQAQSAKKTDYYILHPARYSRLLDLEISVSSISDDFKNPKHAKGSSHRTDQLIIDFGNKFLPYREFGNSAISEIINSKLIDLYKFSILHLEKNKQKKLMARFNYIINNNTYCYSFNDTTIERALLIFSHFISKYKPKAHIRNTINDMLILATAIEHQKKLLTQDNLLKNFVSEHYEAAFQKDNNFILIDFSDKRIAERIEKEDSKGYIHSGWSYSLRNQRYKQKMRIQQS